VEEDFLKSLMRDVEELNSDMVASRRYIQAQLKAILDYACKQALTRQTPSTRKPIWARVAVQCGRVLGDLLKDFEMENLERRVTRLEKQRYGR
jgi:hypothetical protein